MPFQNYHKHSDNTNIIIPDSACSQEDYAIRAKELGHRIITSMEHGWQGNYFETYKIAKKYGLKFIFGTEAYFVKDRKEKDGTNCHICLFARNEEGRREINEILSESNISGFYKVPRIDIELMSKLSWENVHITTACIAFFKYGIKDSEEIIIKLHQKFRKNFQLEVQYHNMARQKEINSEILRLSSKYNIEIIMGCDSHYIHPKDCKERDNVLQAKGIYYETEEGCILDYPNEKTAIERFKKQGILSDNQIKTAIENTNIFLEFEDIEFNKNIKLPSIHKDKTEEQKNELLKKLVYKKWKIYKKDISFREWEIYEKEIEKELICIINTKMADYFLIDYEIVKKGIEKGGRITLTGRGSAASYFINTLLGFSKVDRISSSVQMYPERFISESRILETKSLPDLDLNTGDPKPFLDAQSEILGEHSSYQMLALGKFKVKSAFKLYARAKNLDFLIANEITKQIEAFELDLKHADDDLKDTINLYDYIEEQYLSIVKESEKYQNIVSDKKPHPCASLIFDGDIRKEIGIMRIKNPKKDVFVAVIEGSTADEFKYLKNDLLKVDVVNIIYDTFKNIDIKPYSVNKLIQITLNDENTWKMYEEGKTVCLNQVEKESTKEKVMRYKPKNIAELTSFIAAIRPSFQSMYSIFEKKEKFIYDIKVFDELLQTKDIKSSFLIYQEQIMSTLSYSGIPTSETYGIIKAIAKKKEKTVQGWKEIFIKGFKAKIMETESISEEKALAKTMQVWKIIDDSSSYGFNASHAYCVAIDSLYCAYLKANYTLDFFEVSLNYFAEKAAKKKITLIKQEAENKFNIKINQIQFRQDNRKFNTLKKDNSINESMTSVKYLNKQISNELFQLRNEKYIDFIDLMKDLYTKTAIQSNQLDILIKLNYFEEFGKIGKLLSLVKLFNKFWQKTNKSFRKQISKAKLEELELNIEIIKRLSKENNKTFIKLNSIEIIRQHDIQETKFTEKDLILAELDSLGFIRYTTDKKDRHKVFVLNIDRGTSEFINPKVDIYSIGTGKTAKLKIRRNLCTFEKNDIIFITSLTAKPRYLYKGIDKDSKPLFEQSKTLKDFWIDKWIKKENFVDD